MVGDAEEKILILQIDVSKARNVNAVGAFAERHFVFVAGHFATGAGAHVVIHEVVAEFAARVGETVGKFGSGGIEEEAGGFQGRSANGKKGGLEFEKDFGFGIDDARAADKAGSGMA